MKIEVKVSTWEASKVFTIEGPHLTHCFAQIPIYAGEQGLALTNLGQPVEYLVRVLPV